MHVDPESLNLVTGAAVADILHGDKAKVTRYIKEAQHLGAAELTLELLQQTAMSVIEQIRHPGPSLL